MATSGTNGENKLGTGLPAPSPAEAFPGFIDHSLETKLTQGLKTENAAWDSSSVFSGAGWVTAGRLPKPAPTIKTSTFRSSL